MPTMILHHEIRCAASSVAGSDILRRGNLFNIKMLSAVVLVTLLAASAVIGLTAIPTIAQTDKPLLGTDPIPAGIPEKFEEAFYEKILETVSEGSGARSLDAALQYYTVVVVVERYDSNGTDVSEVNKARIVEQMKEAGAKDIASAETLSFVIAQVPVGKIMGLSTHEEVHLLGDGQLPLHSFTSNPVATVNATVAALTTADGTVADGSGARVAVLERTNIDYSFVNEKIILSLDCSSHPCTPASSLPDSGIFHADGVAHFIGTTGHADHNGISPGAEIISLASGTDASGMYYALDWAASNDVDVVNTSIGILSHCSSNDARYSINVISNDVVLSGTTLASSAGNQGPGYETLTVPCSYNIINVGGIDDSGSEIVMYNSSSRGPYHILDDSTRIATVMKPEIVAPAYQVPIATPPGYSLANSGTSFSAPQVSAAVAVLVGENGRLSPEDVRATLFLGANWTGPVPCTSVQFEQNNAADDCSYARKPPAADATSTSILNNVGFGILNVGQSLHYTLQGNGQHVVAGDLLHDDVLEYKFTVTDTAKPAKVILTWLNNAFDAAPDSGNPPTSFTSGRIYNLDLEVTCPGMDAIHANSTHQNNEFAVFIPTQAGTCTAQVDSSDTQSYSSRKQFALASTIPFNVESASPSINVTSSSDATVITLTVDFGSVIDPDTFTASDVTTSTGTVSEPTSSDNQTFGFSITNSDADEDIEISIAAGTVEYNSGNINAEAHTRIERAPPTVVLSTITPSPTNAQDVTFTATFSEPVAFANGISDISVTGGAASNLQPSDTSSSFTFTVTPDGDGAVTVQIPADAANDGADNGNVISEVSRLAFDRTSPVITITGDNPATVTVSTAYTDAGATCTDAVDGSLTPTVINQVNTGMAGTYSVIYSCIDAANNIETTTRSVAVVTADANAPPTFVSSTLDSTTGTLEITFSEAIDATPATNVVSDNIHIRESGTYTGGVTLTAAELVAGTDGSTISFDLTESHLATVAELTAPELTIEPGAVRDTSGNLIASTFDVSTRTHIRTTPVEDQDDFPQGMAFSNDGTKMFVIGVGGGGINEYTLSTAFDTSTLTHDDTTTTAPQEYVPYGMAFSNDGLKMFVVGSVSTDVNQYTLSTAFDASTRTFANPISTREDSPSGMAFSGDGLKMFVIGTTNNAVNEFALSTAFDVSTAVFVDATSISHHESSPQGIAFSNDGTKMFVIGSEGSDINEYTLSPAFDVSTLVYVDATSISDHESQPTDMAFSSDGSKMFVIGYGVQGEINEYALSSVYPITLTATYNPPPTFVSSTIDSTAETLTITFSEAIDVTNVVTDDIHIRESGTYTGGVTLTAAELLTGTDSATISFDLTESHSTTVAALTTPELTIEPGAVQDTSGSLIVGTFDVSTAVFVYEATDSPVRNPTGMAFSNDGLKMFVIGEGTLGIYEYTLSDPFDVRTLGTADVASVAEQEDTPTGMAFSNDGLQMFVIGNGADNVNEYTLSPAFDASTLQFINATLVRDRESGSAGMAFSNDGLQMFVIGNSASGINEYTLSAPFDIYDPTFARITTVETQSGQLTDMAFSNDGLKMFVVHRGGFIGEYTLSTPFDVRTLSSVDVTSVAGQERSPTGMAFSNDGSKMFVIGTRADRVQEYTLTSVYPIMLLSIGNESPMVDAGPDQSVAKGSSVILSGVSATDADSDDLTYSWSQDPEDTVTFNSTTILRPNVTAPSTTNVEAVTLTLTVNDGTNEAVTDTMALTLHDSQADNTHFITTWQTTGTGDTITIPGTGSYTVDWGDGMIQAFTVSATHTYDAAGTHTVRIFGGLTAINLFDDPTNAAKLQSIEQWGNIGWTTMESAFDGASNMVYNATDSPDLSRVTSMAYMFRNAQQFNGDISSWDTSNVESMTSMFENARTFNQDISGWTTSNVESMTSMFYGARTFDHALSDWDVSSVTNMGNMFRDALVFNSSLSNWIPSSVTSMNNMFEGATDFNQDISGWRTSSVSSMNYVFFGAADFNQDISDWDVSGVIDKRHMRDMFKDARDFDQNLGRWYIDLDSVMIAHSDIPGTVGEISAQNVALANHNATYGIGSGDDSNRFEISDGNKINMISDGLKDVYTVNVTASGDDVFEDGNNWRTFAVNVTNRPIGPPPTFVSSALDRTAGTLAITFSEAIDVTPATNVVSDNIHIRESGTYTGGVTLTAAELATDTDGSTISFSLTASHLAAVAGLATPELTIDPGAVRDADGRLIVGTFDVSTASYDSRFSVLAEETGPTGLAFSSDGTKMFVVGIIGDYVNEYALSTAFDVSTASYDSKFRVFAQESLPTGLAFSNDGTKMFISGASGNDVNEYALSTAFDVSTASYDSRFSVAVQGRNPEGVAFSNDGTKMFVADGTERDVNEYDLSSPFNVTAASFAYSLLIEFQDTQPRGVAFSNDGTKMFVVGDAGNEINEYTLSTAFDIRTASYHDRRFSVAAQDTDPQGMAFSNDGAKMFVVGDDGNDINEYALSSVYPVTVTGGGNAYPVLQTIGSKSVDELDTLAFNAVATDADDGTLEFSLDPDPPAGASINSASGAFSWTPTEQQDGTHTVTVLVEDDNGGRDFEVFTVKVNEVNAAPVLESIGPKSADVLKTLTFTAAASDTDVINAEADTLEFSLGPDPPAGASINSASGAFSWTPTYRQIGTHTVTVLVEDDNGGSDSEDVTITVNKGTTLFVTTWQTTVTDEPIDIPGTGSYTVDWGDGSAPTTEDGYAMYTYSNIGTYTVSISGDLMRINLGDTDVTNAEKLQSIEQWGNIAWSSMNGAFKGASNMVYSAADAPDLSGVTDMSNMFTGASIFNGDLSSWDTSSVTDMSGMFSFASAFTGDISGWDVSGVTDMSGMFTSAREFRTDISSWDTSRVTDMSGMFNSAVAFSRNLSSWNTSSVTDMSGMFNFASAFTGDISGWNTSSVTDMSGMFVAAGTFNSDISSWDTSSVTDMSNMFFSAGSFNSDISYWNVSSVTDMDNMFDNAASFEQNLGKWYVVPDDTSIDSSAIPGTVGQISAQNDALGGHDLTYGIGSSDDYDHFEIVSGNSINMISIGSTSMYTVNVTASGSDVFESGKNWHTFVVDVTGKINIPPDADAGPALTVHEGGTFTLSGATATDGDAGDVLTYSWTAPDDSGITFADPAILLPVITVPAVDSDTDVTLTLAVDDQSGVSTATATDTVVLTVKETSNHFVTTWQTATANKSITVPGTGTYAVIWGDGTSDAAVTNSKTHEYAAAGTYTVSISGGLTAIDLGSNTIANAKKLQSIEQWGDIGWNNMNGAFLGASNMVYSATDAPDLSDVTDMTDTFRGASKFNGDISDWNTSGVTDMEGMFNGASKFNGDISGWNVSGVDNMSHMFNSAADFNQDLSGWNVSSVTDMNHTFRGAADFNQDLSGWNVSSVTDMDGIFTSALLFNGNISDWDVSGVDNMSGMFFNARAFNSDISDWDVSGVTNMLSMFDSARAFNSDISDWNVSSVTNMGNMFNGATSFQQSLGKWYVVPDSTSIDGSDVPGTVGEISAQNSALDDHFPTYGKGSSADSDRFEIVPGNLIRMTSADRGQTSYVLNVTASGSDVFESGNNWSILTINVTGIINSPPAVDTGTALTVHEGGTFTLSGVTATDSDGDTLTYTWSAPDSSDVIIADSTTLSPTITAPAVDSDTNVTLTLTVDDQSSASNAIVTDTVALTVKETSNHFVTTWETGADGESITIPGVGTYAVIWGDGTSDATVTDSKTHEYAAAGTYTVSISGGLGAITLAGDDENAEKLQSIEQWGNIAWSSMSGAFQGASNMVYSAADAPDLSGVTDMSNMFTGAAAFNSDLSSWDTSSVTDMSGMFSGAAAFNSDLSSWDTSSVTDMSGTFSQTNAFNGNVSGWNVSGVTSMAGMFNSASAFHTDISSWNTSSVTDMSDMFELAILFNRNLSSWNTSAVTDMSDMFNFASSFNGNISGWDVSGVTNMSTMFIGAHAFKSDLSSWNTSSVTNMSNMFFNAGAFNSDISDWNVSGVTNMGGMFDNAASFEQNLGKWYVVPDDTSIDSSAIPGIVGEISAQNSALRGHDLTYGIGSSDDYDHFEIVSGNRLNMTSIGSKSMYTVNVTASGSDVFESGKNWHTFVVDVTGKINSPPDADAGPALTVHEGGTFTLSGATATDGDAGDVLTYSWTAPVDSGITFADPTILLPIITVPAVDSDTDVTLTLTVDDQSGVSTATATDTVVLTVKEISNHFVTTWQTTTANESITVPGTGTYAVIWGDGTSDATVTDSKTHEYAAAGTYTVSISGGLGAITLAGDDENAEKLQSIEQWGNMEWNSMNEAFKGASSMVYNAADAPDLSGVSDMTGMFRDASAFNGDLSGWDVSGVNSTRSMFRDASNFNQDISLWDTRSVTDMSYMFTGASNFDSDISLWNTTQVTDMSNMFWRASNFDSDISGWNVSDVINMRTMFLGADAFDQNLGTWYVVPNNTSVARSPIPGIVGMISAQNSVLDGHNPEYGLGSGTDLTIFNITEGDKLSVISVPPLDMYTVNVTASGKDVFEDGKNWHTFNVTVTGMPNRPPTSDAGPDLAVNEGVSITLNGTGTDPDTGDTLTYEWTQSPPDSALQFDNANSEDPTVTVPQVDSPVTLTLTLTVSDGTDSTTDTMELAIRDSSADFVTTWTTTDIDKTIIIPAAGSYTVDWGDGNVQELAGPQTYAYATAGTYTVRISGGLTAIDLGSDFANAAQLQSIDQWGSIGWTTMERAFQGASNMRSDATDIPDLSKVASMNRMFDTATKFDGDLSGWNTSAVTSMHFMFSAAAAFDSDISGWDVSQVTDMDNMFRTAAVFNQDLSLWNVSQVTDMSGMFDGAADFNGDLSGWNTSAVTDMSYMFSSAADFNSDLSGWNTSAVTDMNSMFRDAAAFNGDLSGWDTSAVTDMPSMFGAAAAFNSDISEWDVSGVTNMGGMFDDATAFDQNLGKWYVVPDSTSVARSTIPGIVGMISAQNSVLDGHNPEYGLGSGTDLTIFNITEGDKLSIISVPSGDLYTVNVTASGSDVFESGKNWHTFKVNVTGTADNPPTADAGPDLAVNEGVSVTLNGTGTDVNGDTLTYEWTQSPPDPALTFNDASLEDPTVTVPQVDSPVTLTLTLTVSDGTDSTTDTMELAIRDSSADFVTTWTTTDIDKTIIIPAAGSYTVDWGDGNVQELAGPQTYAYATAGTYTVRISGGLTAIDLGSDFANAAQLQSIDQWGSIGWTTMERAFQGASNMRSDATDIPDLSKVASMNRMFDTATKFDGDLSGWNTSAVTSMHFMFSAAAAFDSDISGWDVSQVTDMDNMFRTAAAFNQDLSLWNVSQVTDMSGMFDGAADFNGDLSGWNTSAVTDMSYMFSSAADFNSDLSGWNTSAVTDMNSMFRDAAAFNGDLSGWDTSAVTDMPSMFGAAAAFNSDISEWDVSGVTNMGGMFDDAAAFDQNLGKWYVVPDSTSVAYSAIPGTVGVISAQNSALNDHIRMYGMGSGTDLTIFNITDGGKLSIISVPSGDLYTVNVTASGSDVFESGKNWHTFNVTVTNRPNSHPTSDAGPDRTVGEGESITLNGTGTDVNGDTLTYEWTQSPPDPALTFNDASLEDPTVTVPQVDSNITLTLTLTVSDGTDSATDTMELAIRDSSADFVTTWTVPDADKSVIIPAAGSYTVDWGDGVTDTDIDGPRTHTYDDAGTYTVRISGGLTAIDLGNSTLANAKKLQSIEQWGNMEWNSMNEAFKGASSMVYNAADAPDLSGVSDMTGMFRDASAFNGDLSGWDVSGVNSMKYMFYNASAFNGDLSGWDVSGVNSTRFMFRDASNFNQDISLWDTRSVTDMSYMFTGASNFDSDISLWNTTQVTDMSNMFWRASNFDSDISGWNVSDVIDMRTMFLGADAFDQNLGTWYVVPNNTSVARSPIPGIVGMISAQNSVLDGHNPEYGLGSGTDLTIFDITEGDKLSVISVPPLDMYTVNITASGKDVFEDGKNWRILNITVTGQANTAPTVDAGSNQTVAEGSTVSLDATVTDTDAEDTLTYAWTHNSTLSISLGNSAAVDTSFTAPNVSEETDIEFTLSVSDGTATVTDKITVTVTDSANSAPTVNAGSDQTVAEGSTVSLDATVTDTDAEDTLTYAWTHNSTLSISLGNSAAVDTSFTAPNVSEETDIEFTLSVSDGTATVTDKITVTVTDSANSAPTVNAGSDQTVAEGSTVSLDATVTDTDAEDTLTYAWTHNSTLSISLGNSAAVDTSFTAPNVSEETDIEFTLSVSDGTATVTDKITVTVTDSANSAPTVNAGSDQTVAEGSTVSLDATVTDTDAEDTLTYAWTHNSTLSISLGNSAAVDTSFTAPNVSEETDIEFTLSVSDGTATVTDKITVTVTDSANSAPTVNAGSDQTVAEGSTVSLDATVTDTDAEDTLTYAWTHNSTLSISLGNSAAVDTSFTAPNVSEETDIEFTLSVSDGTATVTDKITVTVTDSANSAPTVNAGSDQTVAEGSTVSLDATVTDTDAEDTLTYAWTHNSTLSISLGNSAAVDTSFTAPNVSEETDIEFTLSVSDGTATVTDKITVTVTDSANSAPTVNAGSDQTVAEGSTVSLDATVTDTDAEDTLTYAWTHNSTLSISLGNSAAVDTSFTAPNVSEETDIEFTLSVSDGTATVTDKITVTVTDSANSAPTVNAGSDQTVAEGSTVSLDATVTDTDAEDTLTYAWTHNSTLSISLGNSAAVDTSFTAPNVSEETDIEFTLSVSDGTATVTDKITVTVTDSANSAPTVNAGSDQTVAEGSTVSLDATVTDTDAEDTLTYAWTHNSTLSISLGNSAAVDTSFTAPNVSEETDIEFTLSVSDGTATVTDKITVTVTDSANSAPTVNAGSDQTVAEGSTVSLDATVTDTDAEDTLTYAWTHNSTLSISLGNSAAVDTSFTAPNVSEETDIEFTLSVSDGTATVTDKITVTVTDSANSAPTVNAGSDQTVAEGSTVSLDATVTDTDAEDTLTYAWTHNSTLSISLGNSAAVDTSFTAPNVSEETDIEFTLSVSDGTATVTDKITVTVTDSANSAPTVNAGSDQTVAEGSTVSLDATVTDTDAEDTLTYAWTHNSTLSISLGNSAAVDTSFTAPNVSEETDIEFTLSVSDGTATVTDKITVTVTDSANSAPTVNAGSDQTVAEGSTVSLDATVTDTDAEDTLTYAWTHNSTLSISLGNSAAVDTSFTAPNVSEETDIEFTLSVSDGTATVTDKITITVTVTDVVNTVPIADAGTNRTVVEGDTITLNGTGTDADGDDLRYEWNQTSPANPVITFDSRFSADPQITAPQVNSTRTFTLTLTVRDNTHSAADTMTLTVLDSATPPPPNRPPTAVSAGDNMTVNERTAVTLSGSATDPDGDALTYAWSVDSGPSVNLTSADTARPQFTAPGIQSGESDMVFRLNVTDGAGGSAEDTVTITVQDVPLTVLSAVYNSGSGHLIITFNQDIDSHTPDYSAIHIRSTGSDSGGITLSNVTDRQYTGRAVTATLSPEQREEYGSLQSPQLDIAGGAVTDDDDIPITQMPDTPISDASRKKSSSSPSSKAPIGHISTLAQARLVDIPPHIAEQVASHDASDPLEPLIPDDTFDLPLVIDGYGYLLDDVTNTLVPKTVTAGDGPVDITFTVYTYTDIAHFTLYLNLPDDNTDYVDSDTYVRYENDGTTGTTDPHGYIADAIITVTQEDGDLIPEKKTVSITVEFEESMGLTNMVVYMWDTDRKAAFIKIIDAIEVVVAAAAAADTPPEPDMQAADPEPVEPDFELAADPEPVEPDFELAADPEPVSHDALLSIYDDIDDAQTLTLVRMWSGFDPEIITDAQLISSLGLDDDYPDADIPDWMMTDLGVLVSRNLVTVDEFRIALAYVLGTYY